MSGKSLRKIDAGWHSTSIGWITVTVVAVRYELDNTGSSIFSYSLVHVFGRPPLVPSTLENRYIKPLVVAGSISAALPVLEDVVECLRYLQERELAMSCVVGTEHIGKGRDLPILLYNIAKGIWAKDYFQAQENLHPDTWLLFRGRSQA